MTKKTLSMDIKVGESVSIDGGRVVLTLEAKSGQRARLTFQHESDVDVRRKTSASAAAAARGGVVWPR